MANRHQTEPPLPPLESSSANDVYSITQLSICDSCDSPPTTSNPLTFSYQVKTKSNGNLLFPLGENRNNYVHKMSSYNLLNYFKSQQIVKNIEIFKEIKTKKIFFCANQQFPLQELSTKKGKFPVKNYLEYYSNHRNNVGVKRKVFLPWKITRGIPSMLKGKRENKRTFFRIKSFGKNQMSFKFKRHSRVKHILKKWRNKNKNWKKPSNLKTFTCEASEPVVLQNNLYSMLGNKEDNNKFPLILLKTKNKFPFVYKFQNETIENSQQIEIKQIVQTLKSNKNFEDDINNLISINQFPCKMFTYNYLTKFPINNKFFFYEHSLTNDLTNCLNINISMTQSDRNMNNFINEHVFQVQDTHGQAMENPRSLTMIEKSKQTPPQTSLSTGTHDDDNHESIHKLADTNSKNNTHSNEVGYYAEKIERLQDAIISLFEKIQNSLITNHKNDHESTTNATQHVVHDNKGNTRFALTPPTNVTSVKNTESINNNNYKEVPYEKFDLGDLYVQQIGDHVVECSEVRDTLTEAVDCGNTKEEINSTGSFLVKSEEPISPYIPCHPPQPLNKTENTSLEYNTSVREISLLNNKKLDESGKKYLESDSGEISDTERSSKNELSETVKYNLSKDAANEMTVTRLNKSEQEKASQLKSFSTNKATDHQNNKLVNEKESNEMKFEMHKIKGALPSAVADRATNKRDSLKTLNNTTTNSNRLPLSTNSYEPRSVIKNDSPNLTSVRRGSFNSPHQQDSLRNRPTALNEVSFHRTSLNLAKTSNNSNTEQTSQRRPSLGALRNTQSTSQLSVDLPRYSPLTTTKPLDKSVLSSRAASIDSSLSDVLPERTRLRRQRRLRAQDSQDEPEDAIERLNRLRARISASLSEVKGVLKQYSTDAENENENQSISNANAIEETKGDDKKEGPVTFRFVKKVRRRRLFSDNDEKEHPNSETTKENQLESKNETDHCKTESGRAEECAINEIKCDTNKDEQHEGTADKNTILLETAEMKLKTNLYTLKEETLETVANKDQTDHCKFESAGHLPTKSSALSELKERVTETQEANKTFKANKNISNNEVQEREENSVEQTRNKDEKSPRNEMSNENEPKLKGAIPKLIVCTEKTKAVEDKTSETQKKLKKKIIIKPKENLRRASLAAVEGSKIESPLKLDLPNKLQRRPSDSEALIKKKLLTAKLNTSGLVEEVTPKSKIVIVKKSSLKNKSNNSTQLATVQTKLQEEEAFTLTAANVQSDKHNKLFNKDNKSITSDKNQDVLVPKQEDLEKQQQQLQLKNEITRQTNSWLPTQLVIDEAASLNKKTIANSVLTPRQKEQEQQYQNKNQNQQEQDQQATIKSTATNFKSNDLQAKDAMLENVTTEISSSTTSEANGQLTREKVVQSTDYHDILQTEIALNTPTTTNRSNDPQLTNKVESLQPKVNENLEKHQTTTSEKQQKQQLATENQQVLKTTDIALIKNADDNNYSKHEDLKASATLKEPCKENTTTSSHVELVQQEQQQQQLQREGGEQSITNETKTKSSPHNSISCTSDITHQTTAKSVESTESNEKQKVEVSAAQQNQMPEQQLAPAPVQTADIISQPEHHKKKIIIKKIIRQSSVDKTKKTELKETKSPQETQLQTNEPTVIEKELLAQTPHIVNEGEKSLIKEEQIPTETVPQLNQNYLNEECSESTEVSESSTSLGTEEVSTALDAPKKERIVKKKVIIKRQKRRLSIGDNFFHQGSEEQQQNAEIETLEKPIAFVSDDEAEHSDEKDQEAQADHEPEEEKKPLKSCILRKEYNIGDEVLYAERFKKTQIKWRHGRIKERITSISYLLDIDGKDVSSHINYLKKFTGRKVSFGGKEYLEIDYEQLAEEEEKAEKLKKRTYSIWNMV